MSNVMRESGNEKNTFVSLSWLCKSDFLVSFDFVESCFDRLASGLAFVLRKTVRAS